MYSRQVEHCLRTVKLAVLMSLVVQGSPTTCVRSHLAFARNPVPAFCIRWQSLLPPSKHRRVLHDYLAGQSLVFSLTWHDWEQDSSARHWRNQERGATQGTRNVHRVYCKYSRGQVSTLLWFANVLIGSRRNSTHSQSRYRKFFVRSDPYIREPPCTNNTFQVLYIDRLV